MIPIVKRNNNTKEYFFQEGCFITELSNTKDDGEVSIAQARVTSGVTTKWHALKNTTERYVIISGEGIVELGEKPPQKVTVGDVVIIPPNCRQRITNSASNDLIFHAICTPRFVVENYKEV